MTDVPPAYPCNVCNESEKVTRAPWGPAYKKTSKGVVRSEASKAQYYLTYWRTFQMSDHLPMWLDLKIDFSEEYIAGLAPPPPPASPQDIV